MNEDAFREALRGEMAAATPPPPMSTAVALGAAKRARMRRRAVWACVGSAAAVLAVAGLTTIGPLGAGGFSPAGPGLPVLPYPSTKEAWPTGPDGQPQEDRTARAGVRNDQAIKLLTEIVSVVPAGYTAPEDPANPPADRQPLRSYQASFEEKVNGVEVWGYMSSAAVAQGDQVGRLLVEVHTVGNQLPAEPCALAQQFWGMQGECQTVTVQAAQVGVIVRPTNDDRFDQWAAYRHPDGVVVFVAQSAQNPTEGGLALPTLPFTVQQLATLAVDERFHLQ
ncbi:hypothetical protein Rhe02_18880 [Rhizocola hellebori]|uniref:Uncharacterized protein n=1 Tax=Rhizocola hellebori TaxID=1392758 RepID=A0A8J3VF17_9ACTN|nr:hypothetical protein [Rhizocola hellebori]GIH03821.1 hypothetical protein Rhe02_18880 [Rhizocola hellebori]